MAGIILTASAADLDFGGPSIQITSPSDNPTVPVGNMTVTIHTNDFNIANQLGGANVNGSGHIHYFIDVGVPTTLGQPAETAMGAFVPTTSMSFTWTNVVLDRHVFAAKLVNNDHTHLNPPAYSMVNVTVA
jgi:hypothetical protein